MGRLFTPVAASTGRGKDNNDNVSISNGRVYNNNVNDNSCDMTVIVEIRIVVALR